MKRYKLILMGAPLVALAPLAMVVSCGTKKAKENKEETNTNEGQSVVTGNVKETSNNNPSLVQKYLDYQALFQRSSGFQKVDFDWGVSFSDEMQKETWATWVNFRQTFTFKQLNEFSQLTEVESEIQKLTTWMANAHRYNLEVVEANRMHKHKFETEFSKAYKEYHLAFAIANQIQKLTQRTPNDFIRRDAGKEYSTWVNFSSFKLKTQEEFDRVSEIKDELNLIKNWAQNARLYNQAVLNADFTLKIRGYISQHKTLPPTFEGLEHVTVIDDYLFSGQTIPSIFVIPASVKWIGTSAFENAKLYTGFKIPKTVLYVPDDAFKNSIDTKSQRWIDSETRQPLLGDMATAPSKPNIEVVAL